MPLNRTGGLTVRPERVVHSAGLGAIDVCCEPELAAARDVTGGSNVVAAVVAADDDGGVAGIAIDDCSGGMSINVKIFLLSISATTSSNVGIEYRSRLTARLRGIGSMHALNLPLLFSTRTSA